MRDITHWARKDLIALVERQERSIGRLEEAFRLSHSPSLSLAQSLIAQTDRADREERDARTYRTFMTWLQSQPEYPALITRWNKKAKHDAKRA